MTDHDRTGTAEFTLADLVECVEVATAAPSIHNSQPWRFHVRDGGVDVYADRQRQLHLVDPTGREMFISVGAAVFTLRLAIHQRSWAPATHLFPDRSALDLVARVSPSQPEPVDATLSTLAEAIPKRHTNRRPFAPTVVPAAILEHLAAAAGLEGATVQPASGLARTVILDLLHTAEQRLRAKGIYRADQATRTKPSRRGLHGVPQQAFGPWDAMEAIPLRDFGLRQPELHGASEAEPYPTFVILTTSDDTAEQWVKCGQALQRMLLLATVHGLAATPMSQPLEDPALRDLVTGGKGQWAQLIVRLGYAPPTDPSPRRRLVEVFTQD